MVFDVSADIRKGNPQIK